MSRRIFCKFFANGACLKGEHCKFSHDWNDSPGPSRETVFNNVCTYYQKGVCSYGTHDTCSHLDRIGRHTTPISLAERPICSFAIDGNCPHGENCPKIHGDMCFICGKYCLHPYRPVEREEHIQFCENKRLEILKLSEEIECSVCLDGVLSKATPSERRFGLLSECDHPFCISCIRNWRSNSPSSGMDVNTALRACPVCRKRSYFVIPSDIWYSTHEEKQEIINSYKAKLRSIDCKYFNFGHGKCPFGTSCFYKHTYSAVGHVLEEDEELMFEQLLGEILAPVHVLEEDDEFMFEQILGETLALADFIEQTGNELEDSEDELEMAYMLMQMGLDASDSSNGDDTKSP